MKRYLILYILLSVSLTSYSNENSLECDPKKYLSGDVLDKVLVHRESAFNICLDCNNQACKFKNSLLQDDQSAAICKRLFCTASFASRGFEVPSDAPRGESSFNYKYTISKEGKIKDIRIISVEGAFSKSDAAKFIKALTRKTKFEPININGTLYELTDLNSNMSLSTKREWD